MILVAPLSFLWPLQASAAQQVLVLLLVLQLLQVLLLLRVLLEQLLLQLPLSLHLQLFSLQPPPLRLLSLSSSSLPLPLPVTLLPTHADASSHNIPLKLTSPEDRKRVTAAVHNLITQIDDPF